MEMRAGRNRSRYSVQILVGRSPARACWPAHTESAKRTCTFKGSILETPPASAPCLRQLQPCAEMAAGLEEGERPFWLTYAFEAHGRHVFSLQLAHS